MTANHQMVESATKADSIKGHKSRLYYNATSGLPTSPSNGN